jgi:hypothetical protein
MAILCPNFPEKSRPAPIPIRRITKVGNRNLFLGCIGASCRDGVGLGAIKEADRGFKWVEVCALDTSRTLFPCGLLAKQGCSDPRDGCVKPAWHFPQCQLPS